MGVKHNLGIPALKQIPHQLARPLAIFKSTSKGLVCVTEWVDVNGQPVIIPIHLNEAGAIELENKIPSAYGREIEAILGPNNDNVLWTRNNEDRVLERTGENQVRIMVK